MGMRLCAPVSAHLHDKGFCWVPRPTGLGGAMTRFGQGGLRVIERFKNVRERKTLLGQGPKVRPEDLPDLPPRRE